MTRRSNREHGIGASILFGGEGKVISFLLGAVISALLFWSSPLLAQPPETRPKDSNGASPQALMPDGEKSWFAHRDFLEKREWEKSRGELEKAYQWKLDQGIRNHFPYAVALIRESRSDAARGNPAIVLELLNYAEKMAPDLSEPALARASWYFSQIPASWENGMRALSTWLEGVGHSFTTPEDSLPILANLGFWILLSFLLTFAAFTISLFIRFYPFFLHHLTHLARWPIPPFLLLILGLLLLFSPVFMGWGWMWGMVLWAVVFSLYAKRAERVVALTFLFFLLLFPAGTRVYSSLLLALGTDGTPEILEANTGAWNSDLYQKILARLQSKPDDLDLLQAVGLMEKRMGRLAEAEQRFSLMTRLDPRSAAGYTNLGNVYFITNRLDQAMEAYRKAAEIEPARAEAYYNMGQGYLARLRMKEAEAEFQRAQTLQPRSISYYTSISSRNPNRLLIDRTIDLSRVWQRILTRTPEGERLAQASWGMLWGGVPLKNGEVAVAAILILLGGVCLLARKLSVIRKCEKCGAIICSRCTRSRVLGMNCVQCVNAFTPNSSADPNVLKRKRADVARYQSRLNALPQQLSWIIPGFGHLIRGNSREGILYLLFFIFFLTGLLLWAGNFPIGVLRFTDSRAWMVITTALFILFYSLVQYRMGRVRSQGGRSHFRNS